MYNYIVEKAYGDHTKDIEQKIIPAVNDIENNAREVWEGIQGQAILPEAANNEDEAAKLSAAFNAVVENYLKLKAAVLRNHEE